MRIVHYLSELRLAHGGVVRCVIDLCEALARGGHEVMVVTFDATDAPASWSRDGSGQGGAPRLVALGWPRFPKPVRRLRGADVSRAARALEGADALHLHVPWESTNLQLARAARRQHVPYVVSTHGMLDDWTISQGLARKRAYLALAGRRLLDDAASVLCTADAERDQARRWFANPRVEVLPLLMDLGPFVHRPRIAAADEVLARVPTPGGDGLVRVPLVLFLSRLHPKKGVEVLIDAVGLLSRRGVRVRLAIAGKEDIAAPGYEASVRSRLDRAGIGDRAALVGLVTGEARDGLLAAADVHALPTSQENWGFSLIESLAAGTAVVTTRGVDIWRELEATGGAVIAEQTPEAFADAIERLVSDTNKARAMGDAGRGWVLKELRPDAVLDRYVRFYASLRR